MSIHLNDVPGTWMYYRIIYCVCVIDYYSVSPTRMMNVHVNVVSVLAPCVWRCIEFACHTHERPYNQRSYN